MSSTDVVRQLGRALTPQELNDIQETVTLCQGLSRHELYETICEHLAWRTLSGTGKIDACRKLLAKLQEQGLLKLPDKEVKRPYQKQPITMSVQTEPVAQINGKLSQLRPIHLRPLFSQSHWPVWNEYVQRYHYLGYSKPFGYAVRYFIESEAGRLGCLLLSGASKSVRLRDDWIGWSSAQRLSHLSRVLNQSRFLIFPWVQVPHLASHVLSLLIKRMEQDYQQHWGFQPVLMETFVDEAYYAGTCYRAAGWHLLGQTQGRGLARVGKTYHSTPKLIFVRPLTKDFRKQLCRSSGQGGERCS